MSNISAIEPQKLIDGVDDFWASNNQEFMRKMQDAVGKMSTLQQKAEPVADHDWQVVGAVGIDNNYKCSRCGQTVFHMMEDPMPSKDGCKANHVQPLPHTPEPLTDGVMEPYVMESGTVRLFDTLTPQGKLLFEKNTSFRTPDSCGEYQVWLQRHDGVQSFRLAFTPEDQCHADWYRVMVARALDVIVDESLSAQLESAHALGRKQAVNVDAVVATLETPSDVKGRVMAEMFWKGVYVLQAAINSRIQEIEAAHGIGAAGGGQSS